MPDGIAGILGKPETAIRTRRDATRCTARGSLELIEEIAIGIDGRDPARVRLGKPESAIKAGRDSLRNAVRSGEWILGNLAAGRDTPDLVAAGLGEPQVVIGTNCNALWIAPIGQWVLGELAAGRDACNLVAFALGKPVGSIGSFDDVAREAVGGGDLEFGDRAGCCLGNGCG